MELEPRRYDRILNEAPDDVLGQLGLRTLVVLDLGYSDVDDDALQHIGVASKGTLRRLAIPMCHQVGSRGVGHLVAIYGVGLGWWRRHRRGQKLQNPLLPPPPRSLFPRHSSTAFRGLKKKDSN